MCCAMIVDNRSMDQRGEGDGSSGSGGGGVVVVCPESRTHTEISHLCAFCTSESLTGFGCRF